MAFTLGSWYFGSILRFCFCCAALVSRASYTAAYALARCKLCCSLLAGRRMPSGSFCNSCKWQAALMKSTCYRHDMREHSCHLCACTCLGCLGRSTVHVQRTKLGELSTNIALPGCYACCKEILLTDKALIGQEFFCMWHVHGINTTTTTAVTTVYTLLQQQHASHTIFHLNTDIDACSSCQ